MKEIMKIIKNRLNEYKINYSYGRKRGKANYPYFIGEIHETGTMDENGISEYEFLLTGFDRSEDEMQLIGEAEKIKQVFPPVGGYTVSTMDGGICIWYDSMISDIPDIDTEINKIQVTLKVWRWKGAVH